MYIKKDLSFKWRYLLNDISAFIFHSNVHLLSSTFWHMLIYGRRRVVITSLKLIILTGPEVKYNYITTELNVQYTRMNQSLTG